MIKVISILEIKQGFKRIIKIETRPNLQAYVNMTNRKDPRGWRLTKNSSDMVYIVSKTARVIDLKQIH